VAWLFSDWILCCRRLGMVGKDVEEEKIVEGERIVDIDAANLTHILCWIVGGAVSADMIQK
jgi:hypothetical protein